MNIYNQTSKLHIPHLLGNLNINHNKTTENLNTNNKKLRYSNYKNNNSKLISNKLNSFNFNVPVLNNFVKNSTIKSCKNNIDINAIKNNNTNKNFNTPILYANVKNKESVESTAINTKIGNFNPKTNPINFIKNNLLYKTTIKSSNYKKLNLRSTNIFKPFVKGAITASNNKINNHNNNSNIKNIDYNENYTTYNDTIDKNYILDTIEEILKDRKKQRDNYSRITIKCVSVYKSEIIRSWKNVINKLLNIDIRLALLSIKIQGDIYIEFDDYESARKYYSILKYFAVNLELLEELMLAYECLGTTCKYLFYHEKAINYYKKQIEIAWILDNKTSELRAYDKIGIQYFYLGNKQKALYYHSRFTNGIYEKETDIKKAIKNEFYDANFNFFDNKIYKNKTVLNEKLKVKFRELLNNFEIYRYISSNFNELNFDYFPDNINNLDTSKSNVTFNVIGIFNII